MSYFGWQPYIPVAERRRQAERKLGKLARQFDCPVTGAVVERVKGAHFRLHILPPVEIPRTSEGDIDDQALMAAVTKSLEDWVRVHPEQWLWVHRRWR